MGILTNDLQEDAKKENKKTEGSSQDLMHVPTGYDSVDVYGGTVSFSDEGETLLNYGLPLGKLTLFVGNSQGGKTTLSIQIADNIAAQLDGDVVLADFERGTVDHQSRITTICGITAEDYKSRWTILRNPNMSTEYFKKFIFKIAEMKKKLTTKQMVDWQDLRGNNVKIYPPTIVILDSIPAMKPDEVLASADLDNNMIGGKMAAANSNMLTSITQVMETYNITLFAI